MQDLDFAIISSSFISLSSKQITDTSCAIAKEGELSNLEQEKYFRAKTQWQTKYEIPYVMIHDVVNGLGDDSKDLVD